MRLDLLEDICTLSETEEKTVQLVKNCLDQKFCIKKILRDCAKLQIYRQPMQHPHPGILMLYEATRREETCILVEKFINGTTLESVLSERSLDDAAIHHIMQQLLSAVEHLHSLQPPVIHRDIKPDNILIDKGHVVLIDFEIAKLMTTRKDVLRTGSVGYAAPEQYYGLSDQQSDIYSMGILLKESCAHMAWRNNEADIFLTIIRKSTAKRQEERYLTISQMQNDFIITCRSCSSTAKYAESIPMHKEQKV